jgi:hypothetical protein
VDQELNSRIKSGGGSWNTRRRVSSGSLFSPKQDAEAEGRSPTAQRGNVF